MEGRFVTVCVFCLLCAAHSHCSSHDHTGGPFGKNPFPEESSTYGRYNDGGGGVGSIQKTTTTTGVSSLNKNYNSDDDNFVSQVFERFGDGKTLSREGFEKLLYTIHLDHLISNHTLHNRRNISDPVHPVHVEALPISDRSEKPNSSNMCVTSRSLFGSDAFMSKESYKSICPVLLYQYLPSTDSVCSRRHSHPEEPKDMYSVWMYATLSIIVISLCGLGGVVVIPVMQQVFYHHLLQFLVALAVGTLCGDALLHLLPHAMLPTHSHSHSGAVGDSTAVDNHDVNMWRGLVAMLGIIFFYFTEKCLSMIAAFRKRQQRKNQSGALPRVRVMRDSEVSTKPAVGEKHCKHKYSSYPYCYGEITDNTDNHQKNMNGSTDGLDNSLLSRTREENGAVTAGKPYNALKNKKFSPDGVENEDELLNTSKETDAEPSNAEPSAAEESYTVIIREHETTHHGHSHQHGHVHAAPTSLSSVAWMVVMGDGLHNFADGISIGAAFAANIAGGFSTALAVFMHELPHELGDFAVLLQAGMSAKQAVFYNMLSSILCFVGMCLGVWLGHSEETTQWVFSAAAGMFLYIALVDMIPELTSNHSNESGSLCQCLLHFAGLMCGVGIMLVIALYERDLKSVFKG